MQFWRQALLLSELVRLLAGSLWNRVRQGWRRVNVRLVRVKGTQPKREVGVVADARTPHPRRSLQQQASRLRVVILVVLVVAMVVLIIHGIEPEAAVMTVGAAGLASAEIATRLLASTSERRR